MENICKQITKNKELVFEKADESYDLDDLAKKYRLTIYLNDGQLKKSKRFGPEVFILKRENHFIGHTHPGKLAKLPAGVNKVKGCKYKLGDLINKKCCDDCDLETNWKEIEKKYGVGINIWRKVSLGINKSKITNIRRSKLNKTVNLHCDNFFCKLFLITSETVYFRGHKQLIN